MVISTASCGKGKRSVEVTRDRGSDDCGSDDHGSDDRGSDDHGSDDRSPDARGSDGRVSDDRGSDFESSKVSFRSHRTTGILSKAEKSQGGNQEVARKSRPGLGTALPSWNTQTSSTA